MVPAVAFLVNQRRRVPGSASGVRSTKEPAVMLTPGVTVTEVAATAMVATPETLPILTRPEVLSA